MSNLNFFEDQLAANEKQLNHFETIISDCEKGLAGHDKEAELITKVEEILWQRGDLNILKPELAQLGNIARVSLLLNIMNLQAAFGHVEYDNEGKYSLKTGPYIINSKDDAKRSEQNLLGGEKTLSGIVNEVLGLLRESGEAKVLRFFAPAGALSRDINTTEPRPPQYNVTHEFYSSIYVTGVQSQFEQYPGTRITSSAKALVDAIEARNGHPFIKVARKLVTDLVGDISLNETPLMKCGFTDIGIAGLKNVIARREQEINHAKLEEQTNKTQAEKIEAARTYTADVRGLFD